MPPIASHAYSSLHAYLIPVTAGDNLITRKAIERYLCVHLYFSLDFAAKLQVAALLFLPNNGLVKFSTL
jgi:hypothetical protein